MTRTRKLASLLLGLPLLVLPLACTGDDGSDGLNGQVVVDASASSSALEGLDVVSEINRITISSPPVVEFTVKTADGIPIVGLERIWRSQNNFIRFTLAKLVPGTNGDPDSWVPYLLSNGRPTYDSGASLVDHKNGRYTFTFNTDVRSVAGIPFQGALTHRIAGQIGQLSLVPLEEQNLWLDFVPDGGPVVRRRDIVDMDSCNECHDNLVFHGRRFETQYCVTCHNPSLAGGEGNFSFMIHRIHAAGAFNTLHNGADYSEVTYPQNLANCTKCHDPADAATPQASNWMTLPNIAACDGCHNNFSTGTHSGPAVTDNMTCTLCHGPGMAEEIRANHVLPNATPHNPDLFPGQRNIAYELLDAAVDGLTNDLTVRFRITDDGTPLDLTNLPVDLLNPSTMRAFRYPGLLLAYALPQDGITEPADYNNMGQRSAQPRSVGLNNLSPIATGTPVGSLSYDDVDGIMTAVITSPASQFPVGATMRAVGLQSYLQQDLDADGASDVSLHTPSVVVAVTGDRARRQVVDSNKCSSCHEWFEGHGGSRVFGFGSDFVCTMCHVPNLSSSGRTIDPLDNDLAAELGPDPLAYPEDTQNFRDLIHGLHSSAFRSRDYEHVRGGRQGYYNWSEVTFPRGASTRNCSLCHIDGSIELPLDDGLLPTTVRTTSVDDGLDVDLATVEAAFQNVPGLSDWVNSPTASACAYCHTEDAAFAHMELNGGQVSTPVVGDTPTTNRALFGATFETCSVCHGPGKIADVAEMHGQ
jgi:OmcA/MtrC family decaheme c-type cytochrome